jgi:hypothetical protein
VIDVDANRRAQAGRGSHRPRHDAEKLVVECPFAWPVRRPQPVPPPPLSWEDRGHVREEEFARAVALGLWDYLRKSRAQGYVVSLSGGADSAACAVLVALSVRLAFAELGPGGVRAQLPSCRRLHDAIEAGSADPRGGRDPVAAAVGALLACAYQPTENSGSVTRNAAAEIARAIGAEFHVIDVDAQYKAYIASLEAAIGRKLSWATDDVTLQNIQARVRAPSIWMLANVRGGAAHHENCRRLRSATRPWTATRPRGSRRWAAPTRPTCAVACGCKSTAGRVAPVPALALVNAHSRPPSSGRVAPAPRRRPTRSTHAIRPARGGRDSAIRDKHTPSRSSGAPAAVPADPIAT